MPSSTALRRLPVVVAGAGPAGASTAIMLERAGTPVLVLEARGPVATRARNIFLRPQAREIMEQLVGNDPGRDTTIRAIEHSLRATAHAERVPIGYHERVVDLTEHADHVTAHVQHEGSGAIRSIDAHMFVDATGGRLAATNVGDLARVPIGRHHAYVTAQYDTPVDFAHVRGAFDRVRNESLVLYPVDQGRGFIAYLDLPPGREIDEASALGRFDAIAGRLQLGTPTSPPQAFDAQQHLSANASRGRILKVGDSAGNADPYIGAGVAAALVDGVAAARAITGGGDPVLAARAAADDVLAGHRSLARQASLMIEARPFAMRTLPAASFDETLEPSMLGRSRILDAAARFIGNRSIPTAH